MSLNQKIIISCVALVLGSLLLFFAALMLANSTKDAVLLSNLSKSIYANKGQVFLGSVVITILLIGAGFLKDFENKNQ